MKFKIRKKTITFPVFNADIDVVVTNSIEKAKERYKLKPSEEPATYALALTYLEDDGDSYIFLKPNSSVATVVHESWHAIHHMFTYRGAELEDEIVAYHLDYLTQKAWDFLKKKK